MPYPLACLWRHAARIVFTEGGAAAGMGGVGGPLASGFEDFSGLTRRRFGGVDEAQAWLGFWRGDPGAAAELRWVVERTGPPGGAQTARADWLPALAERLATGGVIAFESSLRRAPVGRLVPAPGSGSASLAGLPALAELPSIPIPENLLDALEDIQIEGAQVKPEVDASIAQVDAGLASVSGASASLTPAPDKVPEVKTSMTSAADKAKKTLDDV